MAPLATRPQKADSEIFNKFGPASVAAGVRCVIMTSCPTDYVDNPGIINCASVEALRDCAKSISLLHAISDKFLLRECLTILVAHTQCHWIEACKLRADCVQRRSTIKLLFSKHLWLLVPTPLPTQTH